MRNIIEQWGTEAEMTEYLIANNSLNNPWLSNEAKDKASERIQEIKEVVAMRLNIIIK